MEHSESSAGNREKVFDFSVQNEFLNQLRRQQVPVEIFLTTGTCFKGRITQYDNYSLKLIFKGRTEIIYKSAVATIIPTKYIDINSGMNSSIDSGINSDMN